VTLSEAVGYVTDAVLYLTEGFQAGGDRPKLQDAAIEAIDTESEAPILRDKHDREARDG